jgi:hypothetical protein
MIQSYRTAITRKKPSAPLKYLLKYDLIKYPVLDYGCGRGFDAKFLKAIGETESYDPHWNPNDLSGRIFQTVLCTYVLNVLPKNQEQLMLDNISRLLADGGDAYITVRRDIVGEKKTSRGLQRYVELDLDIITQNSGFCIYQLRR